MKLRYILCALFFLCFLLGFAQEDTTAHTVVRGETIIQIAKKYNVTPYDIQQANRETLQSLDAIKEGDVLIIPKSKIQTPTLPSPSATVKASVAAQSSLYTVKKGETKYSLARRFGMSIPELESRNPHIISGLNEGHVLNVPGNASETIDDFTVTTARTGDSISFDGYKTHLVLKGETLWGISHRNGLTVEQLVGENTDVLTGILREGQTLKIPQVKTTTPPYPTYLVVYGDTKYSLAKKYNITIEALERLNPHIVRMLQAGHTLRIPSDDVVVTNEEPVVTTPEKPVETTPEVVESVVEKPAEDPKPFTPAEPEPPAVTITDPEPVVSDVQTETDDTSDATSEKVTTPITNTRYVDYVIKPKETLYGLSKKADMSIADFVKLNPQLKESVQVGMVIKMPNTNVEVVESPSPVTPSLPTTSSSFQDLSKSLVYIPNRKVVFIMPLSESELNDNIKNLSSISKDEAQSQLEFYAGAKMAIDSLKYLGQSPTVSVVEFKDDKQPSKVNQWVENNNQLQSDAIVVPFNDQIGKSIANHVSKEQTPVITTTTISHQESSNNLFSAVPSINAQRKKVLDYLVSKKGNIIAVCDANRTENKDFISSYIPNASFVELKKNGSFNENDLVSMFKKDQMNYVILDSERNSVFLNVTNVLLSELNSYSIQLAVLEQGIIPDDDDVSVKRFRILKMLFPSLGDLGMVNNSDRFAARYANKYNVKPTYNSQLGFDITFDTLLRLYQPKTFEASAANEQTKYSKLTFDYQPNALGGFSNTGIYVLQYDTNLNIQEAD